MLTGCEKLPVVNHQDQLTQLDGQTFLVQHWYFEDQATGEAYDLKWANSENDSIYIHFTADQIVKVSVDRRANKSYYQWRVWNLQPKGETGLQMLQDIYQSYDVTDISDSTFSFEGIHDLHLQFQTNSIQYTRMEATPERIKLILD